MSDRNEPLHYQSIDPENADKVPQFIRRIYGDSYPLPQRYDRDWVATQIASGLLYAEIACNVRDEAIGNICTQLEAVGDATAGS